MSLNHVLTSVSFERPEMTLGPLLRDLVGGMSAAHGGKHFSIWLAEQVKEGNYFFYEASRLRAREERSGIFPITDPIEIIADDFSKQLTEITRRPNSQFIQIHGTRFGQKAKGEFLKPVNSLVGALEIPKEVDPKALTDTAKLCAALIWHHRASRFLSMENELSHLLKHARTSSIDWKSVKPKITQATNSSQFAVIARKAGSLSNRLDLDCTILGAGFYRNQIQSNIDALNEGRWLRSIKPVEAEKHVLFWMLVPLRTAHYKHEGPMLKPTDKVQHYVIFETDITRNDSGRFIYSSVDRRLAEHSLTRFLEGIAEYRIDEMTRKISQTLPTELPKAPDNDVKRMLQEICRSVYDVVDACVVSPAVALNAISGAPGTGIPAIFAGDPFEIDAGVLQYLLQHDQEVASHLDSKHADQIKIGERSGLVFSVGSGLVRRSVIFIFDEPYSSYVTTEICSRLAARLQLFFQSCDLRNDRTASLTQIAHVLRGPVSSALEEIKSIIRDRARLQTLDMKFIGAKSEDEKLAGVVNSLSRSRSITDSAKHLLGELGPQSFQKRRVDLLHVVSEVRAALEVERKRRRLTIGISDKISRSRNDSVFIWGDEDLLWLLLYNLLENAIKYARRDSTISLVLVGLGPDTVRVSVENFGDLIWDVDKDRIFAPYQRALNTLPMNGREGTGIGLPAANQIARAFNPQRPEGITLTQSGVRSDRNILGSIEFSFELQRAN